MAEDAVTELPFIRRYRRCFENSWRDETEIDQVRFVVLDSETTGFDAHRDRIISIGAVAVQNGEIVLGDSFEELLKVTRNTEAVTVHGITRDQSREGRDEPEVLEEFLEYLKDGVIVGHHIGHDLAALDAGYDRHWGFRLANRAVDTATLTLNLEKDGAFSTLSPLREITLDALCELFGVIPYDRHTASGDALITALIFLRLRRLALKLDRARLGRICEP